MTDQTDQTSHPSADTLADLDAGLLDPAAEREARQHMVGCDRCRADLAALQAVPGRLAAVADAGPVPDDVVHRLDAALAAVAAEPASTAVTRTVTPLRAPEQHSPRGMRVLQVAAVVVLLLAGGALGVSALRGGSSGSADSTAADSAGGSSATGPKAALGSYPLTASGTDWTAASLASAAPQLAAGTLAPTVAPSSAALEDGAPAAGDSTESPGDVAAAPGLASLPTGRLAGGTALAGCVAALADGPVTPLAVDLAQFKGQPAAVILLPGLAGADKMDIWVVGPDCTAGNDQTLYYASVPRP